MSCITPCTKDVVAYAHVDSFIARPSDIRIEVSLGDPRLVRVVLGENKLETDPEKHLLSISINELTFNSFKLMGDFPAHLAKEALNQKMHEYRFKDDVDARIKIGNLVARVLKLPSSHTCDLEGVVTLIFDGRCTNIFFMGDPSVKVRSHHA